MDDVFRSPKSTPQGTFLSKIEAHRQLNDAGTGVEAQTAPEIARDLNQAVWIHIIDNADVADRIASVGMIQNVEEVRPQFKILGFPQWEPFEDGEIHIEQR